MEKEKPPSFIREFSKQFSPQERQKTAEEIKKKRAEYFAEKKSQIEKKVSLERSITERERILAEKLQAIKDLENKIYQLSTSRFKEILNYFQLQKLRAELVLGRKTYEELKQQQNIEIFKHQEIISKLKSEEIPPAMQEAKNLLENFYKRQKEKWERSEYTKEEIMKYFSEENLSSLSLEDYVLLLKRFPCEMVTHVTRQGIRDHIGMAYHTKDESVYADGFMKMIEDGRLRPALGVYLIENEKEQAIAKFLHLDKFSSKEEALNYLSTITGELQGEAGSYADMMAIHFAAEEVADCFYGAEKGNEIFIAYPSAYIASQYYFSGPLTEGGGGYWNDLWVWANEERGMDLNAGIIFIPEDARVDRKTGSRYELDENKNPIKNSEYITLFKKVVESPDFHDFAREVMEITEKLTQRWDDQNLSPQNQELLKKLEPFRQKLENDFGIKDKRLQYTILNYHNLFNLDVYKRNEGGEKELFQLIDSEIERALKREGILFVEAKDTITSKEFWETYFANHPGKRPSKIVYYKGPDPTAALWQWRKEHGLYKKAKEKDLGFSERHVKRDAPQVLVGIDRFKTLCEKVIEDYFIQKETVAR